jgi:hypothetical protein
MLSNPCIQVLQNQTSRTTKIKPASFGIRELPWVPVLATALLLHRCYIPGGSFWQAVGGLLWIFWPYIASFLCPEKNYGTIRCRRIRIRRKLCLGILAGACLPVLIQLPVVLAFQNSQSAFDTFRLAHKNEKNAPIKKMRVPGPVDSPMTRLGEYPIYGYFHGQNDSFFVVTTLRKCDDYTISLGGFVFRPPDAGVVSTRDIGHTCFPAAFGSIRQVGNWFSFTDVTIQVKERPQLEYSAFY